MSATPRDSADDHLDRWAFIWTDSDGRDRETEGAVFRMSRMIGGSMRGLREELRDEPLTYDEFMTLHQLNGGQPHGPYRSTPAELAKRGGVTRAAITGRVNKLVEKSYVTRTEDADDRRRQIVEMTPAGEAIWFEILQRWSAREKQLLDALSIKELKQLNALLRKIITAQE